jgi:hypothetical protein
MCWLPDLPSSWAAPDGEVFNLQTSNGRQAMYVTLFLRFLHRGILKYLLSWDMRTFGHQSLEEALEKFVILYVGSQVNVFGVRIWARSSYNNVQGEASLSHANTSGWCRLVSLLAYKSVNFLSCFLRWARYCRLRHPLMLFDWIDDVISVCIMMA